MDISLDQQTDIRIQSMIALIGCITPQMRAIRVHVTATAKLVLLAYFEKSPRGFEKELLRDAVCEIAGSLYQAKLEPESVCILSSNPIMSYDNLLDFENTNFGAPVFECWLYVRYGEISADDEDADDRVILSSDEYLSID